jgi:hypothetical protein
MKELFKTLIKKDLIILFNKVLDLISLINLKMIIPFNDFN